MSVSLEMKSQVTPEGTREKPSEALEAEKQETDEPAANRPPDDKDPEEAARVNEYLSKPLFRRYFLECIFVMYTLGTALYNVPINTVMTDKSCLYAFGYNESVCDKLQDAADEIKSEVLAYTNTYSTVRDFVMNVPGGLAAVIVGNYLTRYGFRTPLIATLAGGTITCVCQLFTVLIMPAPVIFNALADFPGSVAGGAIVISTALYTNIALRVPEPFRLQRITAVSFFGGVPALIAIFSGAKLSELFGMKVLMACSGILIAVPTVLVIIFLEEIDVPEENKKDSWRESLWLSLTNGLKTSIAAVRQKRPERRQTQIICVLICMASISVGIPATAGGFAIAYTRRVLNYDPFQFTLYTGGSMLVAFACLFPMVTLSKKLKISPPVLIVIGSVFFSVRLAVLALTEFFHPLFYIQIVLGIPYIIAPLSVINYLSSLVDESEVSQVMALVSLIEKFVPLASGSLGTYVYDVTSVSFPGCFYLILTFVYFIPIGLGVYCRLILAWNKRDKEEATQVQMHSNVVDREFARSEN